MNFIILGDKFQKRMKSKGCAGLYKIKNQTLIEKQYNTIKNKFPNCKIIYISGFEGKKLTNYIDKHKTKYHDLILINNKQYDKYNHAHSLSLASKHLDTDCMICFGDKILSKSLFKNFDTTLGSQVFIDIDTKNSLGCIVYDGRIQNISYDLPNYLVDMFYLSKNHTMVIKKILSSKMYYNYFVFEILNQLIDNNETIIPFQV